MHVMCAFLCSQQECEFSRRRSTPQDERVWGADWCAALCHPDSPGYQWDRQQGLTFPSPAFLPKFYAFNGAPQSSSRFSWVFFTPQPFSTQHLSTFSLLNVRWEWKHYAEYAKTPLWKKAQFCCKKACLGQLSLRRHAHRPPTVRSLNIWWISLTKLEIPFPNLCCISQKPTMDASDQHSPAIMCSLRP